VRVYDGAGNALDVVHIPGTGDMPVAAGDIDGSGRAEIVVGRGGDVYTYVPGPRNTGNGNFGLQTSKFNAYPYSIDTSVGCGDLDGDGRPEIVTAPSAKVGVEENVKVFKP
jgi:hypothetical protein